jgi:hypothetical protein
MNESQRRKRRDPPAHDDIGRSGQCPYTHGPCPATSRGRRWTMRQIAASTPSPTSRLKGLWGTSNGTPVF